VGSSDVSNGEFHAFIQVVGRPMRDLGTLGGGNSQAVDVNDATQVVGGSDLADGSIHAFLWTARRGMEDLGTLGGVNSFAIGISQTGQVVGVSQNPSGSDEAFLWTRGRGMRSLGTLGGPSLAAAINAHRRVVGSSFTADDLLLPFLWTPEVGIRPLPTLGGDFGQGIYLNEFGNIVGFTTNARGAVRATLWTPTPGPLVVDDSEPATESESVSGRQPTTIKCAAAKTLRGLGNWSRFQAAVVRGCVQ
jgi:probable HAF family extracellular repeat protein